MAERLASPTQMRLLKLSPEVLASVQRLFDATPGFFEAVSGQPPGPGEAVTLFEALPPGRTEEHKRIFGLLEHGQLAGVAEVIRGWNTPAKALVALLLIEPPRHGRGLGTRFMELSSSKRSASSTSTPPAPCSSVTR